MKIEIGTKVTYSVQFLASIGARHSDMAMGRGIVTGLYPLGKDIILAVIAWDNPKLPQKVNIKNLAVVGLNSNFSAC